MIRRISHAQYLFLLTALFSAEFLFLAIAPYDLHDWALENFLVVVFLGLLFGTYKRFPLSRVSYTLIFIFLGLHEIGAHFTYAEVPYDQFFRDHFGFSFNELVGWQRNNFDRVVHFSYGLLLAYPMREFYFRVANAEGFWGYFLPLDFTMASSMLYELFEWFAAEVFGGGLGVAYLGTQGDVWDAQKDMAMASLGALIAMLITLALNSWLQKDFAREWALSLSVKHDKPLGEDEIARMLAEKSKNASS